MQKAEDESSLGLLPRTKIQHIYGMAYVLHPNIQNEVMQRWNGRDEMPAPIMVVREEYKLLSNPKEIAEDLLGIGIRGLIGMTFDGRFQQTAMSRGLVCVVITGDDYDEIAEAVEKRDGEGLEIDLERMLIIIEIPGTESRELECVMPESHRESLLDGTWPSTQR